MVNFNGGDLVVESVRRCLAAELFVEVRVGDNGSSDGSVEALRHMATSSERLFLTEHGKNLGFATACNRAIEDSRGDYLLLLNPDCLIEPDTLEKMIEQLDGFPQAGMAGCRLLDPDGSEQRGCRRNLPTLGSGLATASNRTASGFNLHQQPLPDGPIFVEAISGAFMLVRREALDQVGLMDEGYFLHCEDLDWCRRFAGAGWKILFNPAVEVVHHQGTCSAPRPVRVEWHKHRGMLRYYRKFLAVERAGFISVIVWCGVWARFTLVVAKGFFSRVISK